MELRRVNAVHQQINLYQPVFRKQATVFGAVTLLQIAAAALLLLLMILTHAHWTLADMQRTARQLDQQVDIQGRQLASLDAGKQSPDSVALDEEITQLTNAIERRNTLMVQFDQLSSRQDSGFAKRFEALAGEQLPGLWLEAVNMDSDNRIELRGIALDARLVPNYVQRLDRSSGLSAQPFETVSVTRLDSDAPQLQFVLRNFKGDATWN